MLGHVPLLRSWGYAQETIIIVLSVSRSSAFHWHHGTSLRLQFSWSRKGAGNVGYDWITNVGECEILDATKTLLHRMLWGHGYMAMFLFVPYMCMWAQWSILCSDDFDGAVAFRDFSSGGALWVQRLDRSSLHWLYLAMAFSLSKTMSGEFGFHTGWKPIIYD